MKRLKSVRTHSEQLSKLHEISIGTQRTSMTLYKLPHLQLRIADDRQQQPSQKDSHLA